MEKVGFRRARVWVLVAGRTERPCSSLPSLKRRGRQEEGGADHGCAALVWPARARCFGDPKDGKTLLGTTGKVQCRPQPRHGDSDSSHGMILKSACSDARELPPIQMV
jgi:hypothetical protein